MPVMKAKNKKKGKQEQMRRSFHLIDVELLGKKRKYLSCTGVKGKLSPLKEISSELTSFLFSYQTQTYIECVVVPFKNLRVPSQLLRKILLKFKFITFMKVLALGGL